MTTPPARNPRRRPALHTTATCLALLSLVSLTACSHGTTNTDLDRSYSTWMQDVQDRWAGQPGALGSGSGVNDSSSRLSVGAASNGQATRIRVSVACQGDGVIAMAVWNGRIADGTVTGRRLTAGSIQCGHDEDLYVTTSSSAITIGPTAGDSRVGWYAATYSSPAPPP
jgi:hypothetical protein